MCVIPLKEHDATVNPVNFAIVPLFHCQPVNLTELTKARCSGRSTMYNTIVDSSKIFAKVSGMK